LHTAAAAAAAAALFFPHIQTGKVAPFTAGCPSCLHCLTSRTLLLLLLLLLRKQTGKVAPFTVGCPACLHNFVQLWCFLSCSSDQSTFTNVTQVQLAADNNATAVKEIDVWTSQEFTNSLYDSCKVSSSEHRSRHAYNCCSMHFCCVMCGSVRILQTHSVILAR
jgi:hypothetical protein